MVRRCNSTGSPLLPTNTSFNTPVALDRALALCLMPPPSMVMTSMSRPIHWGGLICRLRNWMSSRVMLPPMPLRMAPLGDLVASLSSSASLISGYFASNSSSCWRFTVMPAFLMPTPCCLSASMASRTAWPLLTRRFSAVRSTSTSSISRRAFTNCSMILSKAIWAISSPCRITRGLAT